MKSLFSLLFYSIFVLSCASDAEQYKIEPIDGPFAVDSGISVEATPINNLSDTSTFKLIELESVNTHHFSPERLQEEKSKIKNIQLSYRYFDWANPTSGGAVHITENDEIEVYNTMWIPDSLRYVARKIDIPDLWLNVQGMTWGNSPSVLVTSELEISKSESFQLVVDELFEHGPRIFYIE